MRTDFRAGDGRPVLACAPDMPYLRCFRDERGYEHTYLLHGPGAGSRPRLLYWFRTPPNVSVGRSPLDDDAMRAIQDANGGLDFDWPDLLRARQKPLAPSAAATAGRRPRSRSEARRGSRPEKAETTEAAAPPPERDIEAGGEPEAAAAPVPAIAAAPDHPVAALIGGAGLARLRAQYAELRARVAERGAGTGRRERSAAQVEALDPDGWRAGEEVVLGIERFEAEAAAITADLARRRRRPSRRRRGRGAGAPPESDVAASE